MILNTKMFFQLLLKVLKPPLVCDRFGLSIF